MKSPKLYLLPLLVLVAVSQVYCAESDEIHPSKEDDKLIIIDAKVFDMLKDDGGYLAIVIPKAAETIHKGTRGERSSITSQVVHSVYGHLPKEILITTYTQQGVLPFDLNKQYLVALLDVPMFRPGLSPIGYQQADCEDCSELITLCNKIMKE